MCQVKSKGKNTQQYNTYALYDQQRILGEPVRMGEKVGKAKAESPKEVEGNVIFGEESLKTGGKDFHGAAPFVRNSGAAFMETTLYYFKVGKIARG